MSPVEGLSPAEIENTLTEIDKSLFEIENTLFEIENTLFEIENSLLEITSVRLEFGQHLIIAVISSILAYIALFWIQF